MAKKNPFFIETLAIIGVGLIGGSLALALKQQGAVGRVVGYGRSRENLETAEKLKVIDTIAASVEQAVKGADVIVLATPVGSLEDILLAIEPILQPHQIITDVGSVKHGVVEIARRTLGAKINQFVPGHPIAGKENSGVAAASQDLYENHKVAVTPLLETNADFEQRMIQMWQAVGADVVTMGVAEHDRVLSITSHLPHLLAYAMVDYFAASDDREKCYEMAAGGFYDFTRIASSDPVMWRDICSMNKTQLIETIGQYQDKLNQLVQLLEADDSAGTEALFADAKAARAVVTEKRKESGEADRAAVESGVKRVRQLVNH